MALVGGGVQENEKREPSVSPRSDGGESCTYCGKPVDPETAVLCRKQHVKVMCEEAWGLG